MLLIISYFFGIGKLVSKGDLDNRITKTKVEIRPNKVDNCGLIIVKYTNQIVINLIFNKIRL